MLKSPEEYFSEMDFNIGSDNVSGKSLNAGEKSFIQKYLGEDALARLQAIDPEPHFKPLAPKPAARPKFAEPRIEVVQKKIEVVPATPVVAPKVAPPEIVSPVSARTEASQKIEISEDLKTETRIQTATRAPVIEREKKIVEIVAPEAEKENTLVKAEVKDAVSEKSETKIKERLETVVPVKEATKEATRAEIAAQAMDKQSAPAKFEVAAETVTTATCAVSPAPPVAAISATERVAALKDRLKLEDEIQMVSFYVAGQLFLLPVAVIQEVLRHMELVKVPRAPDFVAGVINLRGRVTPLVHLSAILTNSPNPEYTEKNFVIICGSDNLQLGLIIDKISSMHMLPQNKIIWNAESKLGDSAEYLLAIANLDDKVCGVVAPEIITQKILAQE